MWALCKCAHAEFIISTGKQDDSVGFALPAKGKLTQQTEKTRELKNKNFRPNKMKRTRNKRPATNNNRLSEIKGPVHSSVIWEFKVIIIICAKKNDACKV